MWWPSASVPLPRAPDPLDLLAPPLPLLFICPTFLLAVGTGAVGTGDVLGTVSLQWLLLGSHSVLPTSCFADHWLHAAWTQHMQVHTQAHTHADIHTRTHACTRTPSHSPCALSPAPLCTALAPGLGCSPRSSSVRHPSLLGRRPGLQCPVHICPFCCFFKKEEKGALCTWLPACLRFGPREASAAQALPFCKESPGRALLCHLVLRKGAQVWSLSAFPRG